MSEIVALAGDREGALRRAALALKAGELVVVPTDTVYGLACDAFNVQATASVFDTKKRPRALALPILVSRPRQAWALASQVPRAATELAAAFWPGALTLILPATELEWDLGDTGSGIALRMPDHEDLVRLLEMTGPLAVTSANVSGRPPPPTVEEARAQLGDAVGLYLDAGPAARDVPSTIVDLTGRKPRIVREGAIPADAIVRALAG